jgi:DNA invertase Pin-like site-specific DNA recombinase
VTTDTQLIEELNRKRARLQELEEDLAKRQQEIERLEEELPEAPTGRVFGYVRVSTPRQLEKGASVKEQIETCIRGALESGGSLGGPDEFRLSSGELIESRERIYIDDVSAYKVNFTHRPAGDELNMVLQRGDTLIVHVLDRAFRNIKDAVQMTDSWKRRGIRVRILDLNIDMTSDAGSFMLFVMAYFAEWESKRRGERVRDANEARRRDGTGVLPAKLGFKVVRGGPGEPSRYEADWKSRGYLRLFHRWWKAGFSYTDCWREALRNNILNDVNPKKKSKDWCRTDISLAIPAESELQQIEEDHGETYLDLAECERRLCRHLGVRSIAELDPPRTRKMSMAH